jgi:hypothetical protein
LDGLLEDARTMLGTRAGWKPNMSPPATWRNDAEGRRLRRDIVHRFECHYDGALVFAADLYPAIAANPYLAFSVAAVASGTLSFSAPDRFARHTLEPRAESMVVEGNTVSIRRGGRRRRGCHRFG